MKQSITYQIQKIGSSVNWQLLLFLLLVLNVKLPIKVAAIVVFTLLHWKQFSVRQFFTRPYLFFYFSMIGIGCINLLFQWKHFSEAMLMSFALGMAFWCLCALAAWHLYRFVQQDTADRLHRTVTVFFGAHIAAIFFNLFLIMLETGALNPYTYKGLNQKYYISTGDFITGISFDAPVTTAFICAMGLLYFLYRRQLLWSMAAMAALLIMASNFANLVLLGTLAFALVAWSSRTQKSAILIYILMLIVFMAKVSPQNNEHVGRIFYQIIDKPYDLPKEKVLTLAEIKKAPDSILSPVQLKQKIAQNYIDSISTIQLGASYVAPDSLTATIVRPDISAFSSKTDQFYQFRESADIEEKINRFSSFLNEMYTSGKRDSIQKKYNWKKPGKFIAALQLINFYKAHPARMLLGNGTGNFSSRVAFKVCAQNIAGRYPERFRYIHPDFFENHLFLYMYYHAQDQSKHEASNTPDAVYYQVAGEYGLIGLAALFILYIGFFFRHIKKRQLGLPLLLLLGGAFFAEYWFEQLSVVVLFELLFFLDMKEQPKEGQSA